MSALPSLNFAVPFSLSSANFAVLSQRERIKRVKNRRFSPCPTAYGEFPSRPADGKLFRPERPYGLLAGGSRTPQSRCVKGNATKPNRFSSIEGVKQKWTVGTKQTTTSTWRKLYPRARHLSVLRNLLARSSSRTTLSYLPAITVPRGRANQPTSRPGISSQKMGQFRAAQRYEFFAGTCGKMNAIIVPPA